MHRLFEPQHSRVIHQNDHFRIWHNRRLQSIVLVHLAPPSSGLFRDCLQKLVEAYEYSKASQEALHLISDARLFRLAAANNMAWTATHILSRLATSGLRHFAIVAPPEPQRTAIVCLQEPAEVLGIQLHWYESVPEVLVHFHPIGH
ncbi:MAG: hypothetical protein ACK5QE_02675 [Sphingobacteriia bacterium]